MYHARTKHINVRYHWLRIAAQNQELQLKNIHTDINVDNMLTKAVPKKKMELCKSTDGMHAPTMMGNL